jgi:hypothetical protein
VTSSRRFLSSP